MATPLIKVESLTRRYGELVAVNAISFEVARGEVLGFLGPNGAGKSTTMQMLTGNLAPSHGSIAIDGVDLLEHPVEAKAKLGYLPERPPLYGEMGVDEFLDYVARLRRVSPTAIVAARERTKERCGLGEVGGRLISHLSKGYQQRVGIAQAIIHNPVCVILDEPTVGLDPLQIRQIRALIRELASEHSVILSTHILPEVQATCDQVQIMRQGTLLVRESISSLTSQMEGETLVFACDNPPAMEWLQQHCPEAAQVEELAPGRFRLTHPPAKSPATWLVEQSVAQGWQLVELAPQRRSLEDIFIDIVRDESDSEVVA